MAESKLQKLARIPSGSVDQQPLAQVPKLPKIFYDRHPEDREALDQYQKDWEDYFKKSASRAS